MRFVCLLLILTAVPGCDDGARVPLQRVTQERDDLAARVERQAEQIRDMETQLRNLRQQLAVVANTPLVNQPTPTANNDDPGDPFNGDYPKAQLPSASVLIDQGKQLSRAAAREATDADDYLDRLGKAGVEWMQRLVQFHGRDDRIRDVVVPALTAASARVADLLEASANVQRKPLSAIQVGDQILGAFDNELDQAITRGAMQYRSATGKPW